MKNGRWRIEKKKVEHWEVVAAYLVVYDLLMVNLAYFFGLWLRFDFVYSRIPQEFLTAWLYFTPWYSLFCMAVFWFLHLYQSIWRFASYTELNRITIGSLITAAFHAIGITVFFHRMPISYYLLGAAGQAAALVAVRFSYRYILLRRKYRSQSKEAAAGRRVMIIGAGAAGHTILRELLSSDETDLCPCCFIDDNPNKWGRFLEGVPVVGGREDILANVEKYQIDEILYAIPTSTAEERRDILGICKESGCKLRQLPGVYQLVNGEVSMSGMRSVAIEDLLGRETIRPEMDSVFAELKGKVILVTGGGGSIGSELCRQIAAHSPKHLIIFDIYENNAYEIEQELRRKYPKLQLSALIGSVRDTRRIRWVFETYHPDIVYHAAAHKHVPLMETSPNEAIKNNVIGTYKTAYAALQNGTRRFVLISTDKAVNPTNIMGASKRLCEMVIQSMDAISKSGRIDLLPLVHDHKEETERDPNLLTRKRTRTEFVAVRFGNVLGSNGSVIPLFKKQIAEGGPVTVTHPDIIRYFMTIPEAVSLVLQAGTYAKGGEIFVLDMGAPVKIDTLARNLIKLSGLRPDVDIPIVYSGLRPGEKLYEEKLMAEEGLKKTENELIHIGCPIPFDTEEFLTQLEALAKASYNNCEQIVEMVEEIVTTFHPVGNKPTGEETRNTAAMQKQLEQMEEAERARA